MSDIITLTTDKQVHEFIERCIRKPVDTWMVVRIPKSITNYNMGECGFVRKVSYEIKELANYRLFITEQHTHTCCNLDNGVLTKVVLLVKTSSGQLLYRKSETPEYRGFIASLRSNTNALHSVNYLLRQNGIETRSIAKILSVHSSYRKNPFDPSLVIPTKWLIFGIKVNDKWAEKFDSIHMDEFKEKAYGRLSRVKHLDIRLANL